MISRDRLIELSGTHYEIGEQIGRLYHSWGKKELFVPDLSKQDFEKQLDIYKEFFPKYLEWLEGVAEGSGAEFERTIRSYLTGFLANPFCTRKACSVFGVNHNSRVLVGRAYDWREATEESAHQISVEFCDSSFSFTALSDMGVWKVGERASPSGFVVSTDDAWNKHGLFVCLNAAYGHSANLGMSCTHIVQAAIEQCKSTDEAVDLICKIPCNDPKFFTVIDKSGAMAVIEKPAMNEPVVFRSNEKIIQTNHYQSDIYKSENLRLFEDVPFHSSFARFAYLDAALHERKSFELSDIEEILMKAPVLQNWRGKSSGDVVTAWVEMLELVGSEGRVQFAPLKKKF